MPELAEEMYCSEQINIPPTFPYLLRQYAKAAIRTQPLDLLSWSAAYFRCLSLNIPPPVKPRLEYPIPRDHYGVTPGWLKALLCQLPNTKTVNFKVLWDRWVGACLKHSTLIEILCLAGFDDPNAIPFLRFIAICVAHLTDNLTQTMILICETLTEEPEGGSAMITLETFIDLYRFLAEIDASQTQLLRNLYFIDSNLELCPESEEKIAKEVEEEAPPELQEETVEVEETPEEAPQTPPPEQDLGVVVSCPDLQADDFEPGDLEKYEEVEEEQESKETVLGEHARKEGDFFMATDVPKLEDEFNVITVNPVSETTSDTTVATVASTEKMIEEPSEAKESEVEETISAKVEEPPPALVEEEVDELKSRDTLVGVENMPNYKPPEAPKDEEQDEQLQTDLEHLKTVQEEEIESGVEEEVPPSVDDEIEVFKKLLYAQQVPITGSLDHYADMRSEESLHLEEISSAEKAALFDQEQASIQVYEEVYVGAIPGIGGVVPPKLVEAVVNYMKEMAVTQHGMVMPRNIRHYRCPPLEVLPQ